MMSDSFTSFAFDRNPYPNPLRNQSKVPLGSECVADVTLRLDSPSSNPKLSQFIGAKRKRGESNGTDGFPEHASLSLGLGSSDIISMWSSADDLGFNFELHLGNDKAYNPTKRSTDAAKSAEIKPIFDLQLSLSTGLSESTLNNSTTVKTADEEGGSASSKLKGTVTQQRTACNKNCQFEGCTKGARGASGLCIAHGGGRRCQKVGCYKGAEGKTVYCKSHGGGRRCQHLGCTKSAEGRTDYCIAHGGGRRCSNQSCTRAARGKSGLCIRHGGGKRCQRQYCTKSAEGFSGLCISHGGGRRCQFPACTKGAQGSTMFCKAHGGGKRCNVSDCTKGAEGSTPFCKAHGGGKRCSFHGGGGGGGGGGGLCSKSVHGGTQFCVAHGGGKRCAFPDCAKSARGRTDYCVRHGGGKRCQSEGCDKSAQGSTDFCKAHGGGNRCSKGKVGLCAAHGALMQDSSIHGGGGGTLQPTASALQKPAPVKPEMIKEAMKSMHLFMNTQQQPMLDALPEGRVHGGRLMAMLSSCSEAGKPSMPCAMVHEWI